MTHLFLNLSEKIFIKHILRVINFFTEENKYSKDMF